MTNPAFWFWAAIATLWAIYGGFSLAIWWCTRSPLGALSAWLAFWLFIITSSIGILAAGQSLIPEHYFFALQRAAWVPAVLTYYFIIDVGLRRSNGRLARLRCIWQPWKWRHNNEKS